MKSGEKIWFLLNEENTPVDCFDNFLKAWACTKLYRKVPHIKEYGGIISYWVEDLEKGIDSRDEFPIQSQIIELWKNKYKK